MEVVAAGPGAGLGGARAGGADSSRDLLRAGGSVPGPGSAPPSRKSRWIKEVRTPFWGWHPSGADSELGLLTV